MTADNAHQPSATCCGGHPALATPKDAAAKNGRARDPICGMSVDIATAKHKAHCADLDFYFCSAGCRTRFQADPAHYLDIRKKDPVCGRAPPHAALRRP